MGFLDQMSFGAGAQQPEAFNFAMPGAAPQPQAFSFQMPDFKAAAGLLDAPGSVAFQNQPVDIKGPQKRGFSQIVAETMGTPAWDEFAAGLKEMGGDTGAIDRAHAQEQQEYQRKIRADAEADMKAEAQAAKEAMEGGGFNQKKFAERFAQLRPGRDLDVTRAKAYGDIYGTQYGMTGSGVPYGRDADGKVTWGQGPPLTEKEKATLEAAAARAQDLADYRDESLDLRERALAQALLLGNGRLAVSQQNAGTSAARLAHDIATDGGASGGMPDLSKMTQAQLEAYVAGLGKR